MIFNSNFFVGLAHQKRGCVKVEDTNIENACRIANDQNGELPEQCHICYSDKCNNSTHLKASMILILGFVTLSLWKNIF